MKRAILLSLLVSGFALQAHAGHGTIRETDTQIIVEYYGDGNDKLAINRTQVASAQPQPPETQPAESVAFPVVREAGQERAAGKAQQDEARSQQNETRVAQREREQEARRQGQAVRATRTARRTGSLQNEE